jgi:heme exporter protein C
MSRNYGALVLVAAIMLAVSPLLVANAPYESTMGLVQKIFYYHFPSAMMLFLGTIMCGISSMKVLFRGDSKADRSAQASAELAVLFGLIVLVTGPLWGRKAWGVYWVWDARLTSTLVLWMILLGYLLVRRYGGPGSEKLSAALALFGLANVPFIYWSVNVWRTLHPKTTVVPSLFSTMGAEAGVALVWCLVAFLVLYFALYTARVKLEQQRARLDTLYLAFDEGM